MKLATVLDDFEDGDVAEWDVNVGGWGADSSRAYNGSFSGYNDTDDSAYLVASRGIGEDAQEVVIYYQETSSSNGGAYELINGSGNIVAAAGSGNPNWLYRDGNTVYGPSEADGYDRWVRLTFTLNSDYTQVTYKFEDLQSGKTRQYTAQCTNNGPFAEVRVVNANNSTNLENRSNGNNIGYEMWTDYIVYEPLLGTPSLPQNVSAAVDSNSQITVDWDPPSDWGGEEGNYHVQLNRDVSSYTDPAGGPTTPGSSTTTASYGPSSDSPYGSVVGIDSSFKFRVRAENSAGNSGWRYAGTVYTDPVPPHNPSVNRPDASTFEVSATVQSDIGTHWTVEVREDTGGGYGSWTRLDWVNGGEGHVSGNPTNKGERVTATYKVGNSYSGNITLKEDARYQFRIGQFDNTEDPHRSSNWVYADYGNEGNVYFEDDFESGNFSKWDSTSVGDADSGVISGDEPGGDSGVSGADQGSYYAHLESGNSVVKELGDLSGESGVIVKCAMAAGSMDTSSETVGLDWYDGSSWNQLRRIGYEYNKQGWIEVTALVQSSWLSTDNRLRLTGHGGSGDYAEFDRVVVSDILNEYTKPSAPSGLTLDTSTEREITASWTDNASVNTKYETKIRPIGESSWNHYDNLSGSLNSYTFTSLLDGEKYEAFARATSEQPRHGSIQSYYYADSSTVSGTTNLPSPSNLSASIVDNNRISASWTDNSNNENGFKLMLSTDGGSNFSQHGNDISPDTASFTTSDLLFNQEYQAKVRAFTEHATADSGTVSLKTGYGLQYYNSGFTPGTMKIYDGDSWVRPFKVKRFDGSQWD